MSQWGNYPITDEYKSKVLERNKMNQLVFLERENKQLKEQQQESIRLLKTLSTQVGTYYGQTIDEHIAMLTGTRFNANEWNLADINGEQGI